MCCIVAVIFYIGILVTCAATRVNFVLCSILCVSVDVSRQLLFDCVIYCTDILVTCAATCVDFANFALMVCELCILYSSVDVSR